MKKEDLQTLAITKVKKMNKIELEKFLGITMKVEVPEDFKIDISYIVNGYNNSSFGRPAAGGDIYKRAIVKIKNQEFNPKELEISVQYFVPSGWGDGNKKVEAVQYILNEADLLGSKDHGLREYLRAKFKIPTILNREDEIPYTLPR